MILPSMNRVIVCGCRKNRLTNIFLSRTRFACNNDNAVSYSTDDCNQKTKLNTDTVRLLEKLSLVNFENQANISVVERVLDFANNINTVNTDNVEPLISVLEDCSLRLRDDIVTDGNKKSEILQNASLTEEDYFVAPPGNIPVDLNKITN